MMSRRYSNNHLPPINSNHKILPREHLWTSSTSFKGFESSSMGQKSASHHSLPATINQEILRKQRPQPNGVARKAPFLRIGGGSRVKPIPNGHVFNSPAVANPRSATNAIHDAGKVKGPASVATALKKMESEDWSEKVNGIKMVSDLSKTNPEAIMDNVSDVVSAVLRECKNLRSSVSRSAIVCVGELYVNLKGKMDPLCEKTTSVLMARSGDVSSAFIREDATEAIENIVKYGSPVKVLLSITQSGAKSKNNTIRVASASFTSQLLARVGPSNALQSGDFLTKLIPLLIGFSRDQHPKVRHSGKSDLLTLSQDVSFDRMMKKFISEGDYNAVKEILRDTNRKGGKESLDKSIVFTNAALNRSQSFRKSINRKTPENSLKDSDKIKRFSI